MSDETDRLADLGADEEADDFLRDTEESCQTENLPERHRKTEKQKNRERMRRKRSDPAYRATERTNNRERMRERRKGAKAERYGKS